MSFFTPSEVMQLCRVNKEANYIAKKVFATSKIDLKAINLRLVKLFARSEQLRVTKDSLQFFDQYKDLLFHEILAHYKNLRKIVINLNHIFTEDQVSTLLKKLTNFTLQKSVKTL